MAKIIWGAHLFKSGFSVMLKFPKIIGRVQATATPSDIDLQISGLYRGHTNWKYPQCNEPQASSTFECTQKCGAARRRGQKSKNQLIIRCHPCTRGASCTKTCVYTQNDGKQRAHGATFSRSEIPAWETRFNNTHCINILLLLTTYADRSSQNSPMG